MVKRETAALQYSCNRLNVNLSLNEKRKLWTSSGARNKGITNYSNQLNLQSINLLVLYSFLPRLGQVV